MQHPSENLIKSVCTTTAGASPSNPVFIVQTYKAGTEWYRKYSDGVIEQGGWCNNLAENATLTNNFVTAYTDADSISVHLTFISTAAYSNIRGGLQLSGVTTTTFSVHADCFPNNNGGYYWTARGV